MIEILDNLEKETKKIEVLDLAEQMTIFKEKTQKDFETFYESYLPRLVFYNNRIVRDKLIAEDIATDSFMKSLNKIGDYNPEKAGFSTWLFTISRNECIQYMNRHSKLTSIDRSIDTEGTTIKDFLMDTDDELKELREIENLDIKKGSIVRDKIKYLKEPYREVIWLREIEGKSYRDITIILRKEDFVSIDESFFAKNYEDESGILQLVDPEKKEKGELAKFYSITDITDDDGNSIEFEIIERDVNDLISAIKIKPGTYDVQGEIPFNMSTLKSQIRNGRIIIKDMVKDEFEKLDRIYL